MLTAEQRESLRDTAWDSIRSVLLDRPHRVALPVAGPLSEPGSAFVTLKKKGRLRGCIGLIGEKSPLGHAVLEAARRVLDDPRFPPVTSEELEDLSLEISVLGPFLPVSHPDEPVVGRQGLYVTAGSRSGLLLPQVAVEQGWDRETFLDHVCRKAGLLAEDWRSTGTEVSVFEAEVF